MMLKQVNYDLSSMILYQYILGGEPGFIHKAMPQEPPMDPEPFNDIMRDMFKIIMPGVRFFVS